MEMYCILIKIKLSLVRRMKGYFRHYTFSRWCMLTESSSFQANCGMEHMFFYFSIRRLARVLGTLPTTPPQLNIFSLKINQYLKIVKIQTYSVCKNKFTSQSEFRWDYSFQQYLTAWCMSTHHISYYQDLNIRVPSYRS